MHKQTLSLALGLPLVLWGCWAAPPAPVGLAQGPDTQVVDLSNGQPAPAGFGKVTLALSGLKATRTVQDLLPTGKLVVVVTRASGDEVTDEAGKEAVYKLPISNGNVVITLPGLPATTRDAAGGLSANPYVFTTLWYDGANPELAELEEMGAGYTGNLYSEVDFGTPTTGGNLSNGATTFKFDKLNLDNFVVNWDTADLDGDGVTDEPLPPAGTDLIGSGFGRADVSAGVNPTIAIQNFTHFPFVFAKAGALAADVAAKANSTSVADAFVAASRTMFLRHAGLGRTDIDPVGTNGPRKVRFELELTGALASGASVPSLALSTYDPVLGVETPFLPATDLAKFVPASSNSAFTMSDKIYFLDVDFSALPLDGPMAQGRNVIDMRLANVPLDYKRLRLVTLGTPNIVSNAGSLILR